MAYHDWSPDGSQVAWTESNFAAGTDTVWITTLAGGGATTVAADRIVTSWSAAGRLLLADGGYAYGFYATFLESSAPNGSNRQGIATLEKKHEVTSKPDRLVSGAWSPTGSHAAYEAVDDTLIVTGRTDIYRVTAAGSSATCLTADMPGNFRSYGVAWR
jgi:Tol biopolymer transport system component